MAEQKIHTDYDFYYPLLRDGPTKDYVDQLVREGKPLPSMLEIELRTSYEASDQLRKTIKDTLQEGSMTEQELQDWYERDLPKTDEQRRRMSKPPRDVLLLDILHNIRYYCRLNTTEELTKVEDQLINMLNTWRNWNETKS
jgi:hypothetical protein